MPTQVQFGTSQAGTPSNTGAIFGLSTDEANAPLPMTAGTPGSTNPDNPNMTQGGQAGVRGTAPKMGTVLQGIASFYHLSADDRAIYIQHLEDANYLAPPTVGAKGKVKPLSLHAIDTAWADAVKDAARSGKTIVQQLTDRAAEAATSSGTAAPTQDKLATNPLDVQALGDSTAQTDLGYKLSDAQQAQLLAEFQSTQNPYLQSSATTGDPGSAGWQEWADEHVREFDPQRFDARKVLAGVDVLRQVLAGHGVTNTTGNAQ